MKHIKIGIVLFLFIITPLKAEEEAFEIDPASYSLGSLGAFAEMVSIGIKELAFGTPMSAEQLTPLMGEALKIADRFDVKIFRETDLLVTDLFPKEVAKGKDLLIVFKGNSLEKYLELKGLKKNLLKQGLYNDEARYNIAHRMGQLLSYPSDKIENLISNNQEKE